MIEAMCPSRIRLEARLGASHVTMIGDPTQVHQLLMNLVTNAMQAMSSGGLLQVELSCESVAQERVATTGPLPRGDYVVLRVQDSGAGIDPSIRDQIFDPFFTTKDVGTGTGLGLSLVPGIVSELGGAIDVASEVGVGSSFTAYLPRSGESVAAPEMKKPLPPARGKSEHILVVDDEESLVQLNSDILTELGYRPSSFTSAEEALKAFRGDPASFDAVITDLRMPHMSGLELIGALREVSSQVPVLLVSGFLAGAASDQARRIGADVILTKPLSRHDLGTALADVLRARPHRTRQAK